MVRGVSFFGRLRVVVGHEDAWHVHIVHSRVKLASLPPTAQPPPPPPAAIAKATCTAADAPAAWRCALNAALHGPARCCTVQYGRHGAAQFSTPPYGQDFYRSPGLIDIQAAWKLEATGGPDRLSALASCLIEIEAAWAAAWRLIQSGARHNRD